MKQYQEDILRYQKEIEFLKKENQELVSSIIVLKNRISNLKDALIPFKRAADRYGNYKPKPSGEEYGEVKIKSLYVAKMVYKYEEMVAESLFT